MKLKKQNIIPLIILLLLQTMVLIGTWNLKLEVSSGFYMVFISVLLSFITILVIFLIQSEIKLKLPGIKKTPKEATEPLISKTEKSQVHREFTDPKSVAEKIFKNVLLKRSLSSFGEKLLQNLADEFDGIQGIFYLFDKKENVFKPKASYAILSVKELKKFTPGEGIPGQASMEEKITVLSNIPDKYRSVQSGLGNGEPSFIYFIPLYSEKNCLALIELGTFKELQINKINILNFLIQPGGKKLIQFREKINE